MALTTPEVVRQLLDGTSQEKYVGQNVVVEEDNVLRIFCCHSDRTIHEVGTVWPFDKDYIKVLFQCWDHPATIFMAPTSKLRVN